MYHVRQPEHRTNREFLPDFRPYGGVFVGGTPPENFDRPSPPSHFQKLVATFLAQQVIPTN